MFWIIAPTYCLLWAILYNTFESCLSVDAAEQYFLGDQWVLASGKQPVLSAWYLNSVRFLTADAPIASYLAAESLVFFMLWAVWQLARRVFRDENTALAATVVTAGYRYLSYGCQVYTNDVFLSFAWVFAIFSFYHALHPAPFHASGGRRFLPWIMTGFWLGTAFQGKYTAVFLVVAILFFMCANRHARRYWKTPGPYLAAAVAFLVLLPHLLWLVKNNFHTFHYAGHVAMAQHPEAAWNKHFFFPLRFTGGVFAALLPSLLIALPLTGRPWRWRIRADLKNNSPARFQIAFLSVMVFLPLSIYLVFSLLGYFQPTRYAMPIGMLAPLLSLTILELKTDGVSRPRTLRLGAIVLIGLMIAWSAKSYYETHYGKNPYQPAYPGRALAEQVERVWTEHYGKTPCSFVAGFYHIQLPGYVHVYGKRRIPVHASYVTLRSTNEEMNRRGGIVLWELDRPEETPPDWITWRFSRAQVLTPLTIPRARPDWPPVRVGIALIPPEIP